MKCFTLLFFVVFSTGVLSNQPELGKRTLEQIQKTFESKKVPIFTSYKELLSLKPGVSAKVTFLIELNIDGNVKACEATYENPDIEPVTNKVCKIIKKMNFGAGEAITFPYVINFYPS